MGTGSVPVSLHWLWIKGDCDTELFCDTMKQESTHPKMVAHLDTFQWTHLKFPLQKQNSEKSENALQTRFHEERLEKSSFDFSASSNLTRKHVQGQHKTRSLQFDLNAVLVVVVRKLRARVFQLARRIGQIESTAGVSYLGRHDFGVAASDLHASEKASTIVGLDHLTSEHSVGSDSAVVRALRTRIAALGPAEDLTV